MLMLRDIKPIAEKNLCEQIMSLKRCSHNYLMQASDNEVRQTPKGLGVKIRAAQEELF
jgi:hypothetical protein